MGQQEISAADFLVARIGKERIKYLKGQVIFTQGDVAAAVFFVQKGKVNITVVSGRGKEASTALLGTGSFFGEGCLTGQRRRLVTATAFTEATIMRIDKKVMVSALVAQPLLAARFIAYLLERNSRMEADLVDHLFNSSEKRLARVLLLMTDFGKDARPEPVLPKVNQEILAEMVGTTRSRISFFMNRFRKLGFIDYNNDTLEVHTTLLKVLLRD